jgi:hypothetical protein
MDSFLPCLIPPRERWLVLSNHRILLVSLLSNSRVELGECLVVDEGAQNGSKVQSELLHFRQELLQLVEESQ